MLSRRLDRTLGELTKDDRLFGGKVVVFGGDFRQVLPVIPKAGREQIVAGTLRRSPLWQHVTVLNLKINMRVQRSSPSGDGGTFSSWLLDVGNGTVETVEP